MVKRRILLVVPRLNIGGAESYVLTTAVGLARRGHTVYVASWGGKLVDKLANAGIRHYLVPIRLNSYLASWPLEYIIKKHDIELVHANSAAAGFAALAVCRRLGIPLVYTAHGVFGHTEKERKLFTADKVICVSEFSRRYSLEHGGTEDKLVTIYNGIDLSQFVPATPAQAMAARRQLGLDAADFVIGIVSRIKDLKKKGHGDIINMLHKYKDQQAGNWRLLVVGKGRGLSELKEKVANLGLSKQVCFVGHSTEVQQLMPAIDVLVLPSSFETFGLVLVEAMALAKPAITYAVGGTPEAVQDGVTGFLIPKNDIDKLYEKLNLLYENRDLADKLGQNGLERVKELFDSERMLDRVLTVYENVCRQRKLRQD